MMLDLSMHTEHGMSETEDTRLGIVFIAIHIQYLVEYCIILYVWIDFSEFPCRILWTMLFGGV